MAHFHLQDLTFQYPGAARPVLDHVELSLRRGEYLVLCGRSGSGKTTLLRHLKTVLTPHGLRSGGIFFNGEPLSEISLGRQAEKIGFVMQDPEDQLVTDKVWHELAFGLESLGVDANTMRLRVAEMASYFGIQDWFHRDVAQLSGGQKQLLNLASIMAMQPEVLILDEPTSQLDPIAAADFLNTVRKINLELGTTILITEHRLEDVFPGADRVAVMDAGKLLICDTPGNVGRFLHEANDPMFAALPAPVRAFYGSGGAGECPLTVREGRQWLEKTFDGREVSLPELPVPETGLEAAPPALRVREGWFRYEKNSPDVLRGLNLQIPKGSISAIVGGNGAGKSTTLKVLCGICKLYRGRAELIGKPLGAYSNKELYHGCVAMLPQDPKSLLVKQTLLEDLREMDRDEGTILDRARLCQVEHLLSANPRDLSGGEQQRAALCKVLLTRPKLLLLDEPTKGMDSFFKQRFARLLEGMKAEGITILLVSHDVEFCAAYTDFVHMFFDGQIVGSGEPKSFFGGNSFYTTAASRMSRGMFRNAVTAEDLVALYRANGGDRP